MGIVFIVWVSILVLTLIIASAKNKNLWNAFLAGALLGIFALIYYIFATSEQPKKEEDGLECDKCKAEITDEDRFCPRCGAKFDEGMLLCPSCKMKNKESAKYCVKCGHSLKEITCEDCGKKFKTLQEMKKHEKICKQQSEEDVKEVSIFLWILGGLFLLWLSITIAESNRLFLPPLFWTVFLLTPYSNTTFVFFQKRIPALNKVKMTWLTKATSITVIIAIFCTINWLIPECPASCDDNNKCTADTCSSETGYDCMNVVKLNCKGNNLCESGDYGTSDCPNCDDGNKCTADSYDSTFQKCLNTQMKGCVP